MVKPGSRDIKASVLIQGMELSELQRFVWMMAESFGLDRRIANYHGIRPIGLYRWDIELITDVINSVLDDPTYYPDKNSEQYLAIVVLYQRLMALEALF